MPDTARGSDVAAGVRQAPAPADTASVLVVDPDPADLEPCRQPLEAAGYRVHLVPDWDGARDVLEATPPDVILIDAAVSSITGSRAGVRRLSRHPGARNTPVILAAEADIDPETLAGLESSFDACVIKPLRPGELLLRIAGVLRMGEMGLLRRDRRELRGEQARMWTVLLDFARAMTRVRELDTILEQLVLAAAQMTCSRRVSLMLPDAEHRYLTIANAIGIDEETRASVRMPIGDSAAGRAFRSARRVTANPEEAPSAHADAYLGTSFESVPIETSSLKGQRCLGVLNMTDRYGDRPFEEWEIEFIDMLGSIAGSVIDDALWKQARESLLKFEHDLQVARRIQQSTFPHRLPSLIGFELGAWSEPAEETGGDTYDVIGFRPGGPGGAMELCSGDAEHALLLLADATGHGIGPALSVIQVRAMLRMAVRFRPDLARIVRDMNEQLCADLPRGRFITAWLGELDAAAATLQCLSAGQGPILHYVAARHEVQPIDADTIPLGIIDGLTFTLPPPIELAPGDIVAVISDGVFEAVNVGAEPFGPERASEIIRACCDDVPRRILCALQAALADFCVGTETVDDRTALIVKREVA